MWEATRKRIEIENPRGYASNVVEQLRELLASAEASGTVMEPEARRRGFFKVDGEEHGFYVAVLPASGRVLLLASWPVEVQALCDVAAD